jgi:aryl-alcohol dehydrogenase-like predicted oxidoreductase
MATRIAKTRKLGPFEVSAIGLGCMSLSHAYGTPPAPADAARLLNEALGLGYSFFDSAALYGYGANETLLAWAVMRRRKEFILATKGGIVRNDRGQREIDSRPGSLMQQCDDSLTRMKTDVIDLYYLHRWDKRTPIEECVDSLAALVKAGKVRAIGLSEVSAATLRKAHAVHPIAAVQSEYSLWTRNPEYGVLAACVELGIGFVAFSPIGRGFLAGGLDPAAFAPADLRRNMPRFQEPNLATNRAVLEGTFPLAHRRGCTLAQLALAWVLSRAESVVPIPGTTNIDHLRENAAAPDVVLDDITIAYLNDLFRPGNIAGERYNAATQKEIDTEEAVA